ncbi:MAG: hypothetical protein WD689_01185 [Gaiellaceae bacterium]
MNIAATAAVSLCLAAAACGGDDPKERAQARFEEYRVAASGQSDAEQELGKTFRQLARAAGERDPRAVAAAAERGSSTAARMQQLLNAEITAAVAIAEYEPAAEHARALADALRRSGVGLRAVQEQLAIAVRDPLLHERANEEQVRRLSAQSLRHSVPAAFARRRAARELALVLDVEPPFDTMFDLSLGSRR